MAVISLSHHMKEKLFTKMKKVQYAAASTTENV